MVPSTFSGGTVFRLTQVINTDAVERQIREFKVVLVQIKPNKFLLIDTYNGNRFSVKCMDGVKGGDKVLTSTLTKYIKDYNIETIEPLGKLNQIDFETLPVHGQDTTLER